MTPAFGYPSSTPAIRDQVKWWRYLPDRVQGDWMLLPARHAKPAGLDPAWRGRDECRWWRLGSELRNRRHAEETSMGVFIGSVVLNVSDSGRAAEFWSQALGYVARSTNPEFLHPEQWRSTSDSRLDHGAGAHLHLDRDDKMHLDLWVDEDSDLEAEVQRLVSLGATRVDWSYPEGAQHVVLADTEGNLFCVCS